MCIRILLILPFIVVGCSNDSETSYSQSQSNSSSSSGKAVIPQDETQKRREAAIATWSAQFKLDKEQATCLVDNLTFDELIADPQKSDVVKKIVDCGANPKTFEGYGQ